MKKLRVLLCGIIAMFAFGFVVNAQTTEMSAADLVATAKDGVITLDKDITLTGTVTINNDTVKELNLNGHNIVGASTVDPMFEIEGGSLKVTGKGTITAEKDVFALYGNEVVGGETLKAEVNIGADVKAISNSTNCIYIRGKGAKADVYGYLEAKGDYSVIQGNGTKTDKKDAGNTIINIYEGATVINTYKYAGKLVNPAIYHPQSGILTVYGGLIQGVTGIEMRSGNLVVKGGTIIGTLEETIAKANNNGPAVMGAGIVNAQHTTMQDVSISVIGNATIKGATALYENTLETPSKPVVVTLDVKAGNFVSEAGVPVFSANKKAFITGGTFNADVTKYIGEGLFVRQDDSNYIVEEPTAIPTVDTIDPEEEVKEVTVGVAKNEEVEDILLDSLAKDKKAAEAVEKAGVSVNVAVEVDKIDEKTASKEVKEAMATIKEKAGKATIAHFFDVTVAVKNSNTGDEIATIPSLAKEIELMVLLPESLKNTDKDVNRKFFVIREHDGKVEIIDAQLSEDGKYLVFKSDKFSTYALAYEDVAKVVTNPPTYDGISTYLILGAVSLIGLAAISLYVRNKRVFN